MRVHSSDSVEDAARRVKALGREVGFPLVRIGSASALHVERGRYLAWIAEGRHAEMNWITPERAARSASPRHALPEAQSVVSVGLPYWSGHRRPTPAGHGEIARYAWGRDYHTVIGEKLERFASLLHQEFAGTHRWYVDTGPAMDKALAARSGLGFYGKNTNVLTDQFGSFVLLGEILTSLKLRTDRSLEKDCGSCRICVRACPTGALGPEYSIDSRRCISYLTIEHRGAIPMEYRPKMGSWVFGCDICQDVCPPTMNPYLNSSAEKRSWASQVRYAVSGESARGMAVDVPSAALTTDHIALMDRPALQSVDLIWLLNLSHREYLEAFRGTAIRRAKVWMLRRNAAVALGNVGDHDSVAPLRAALSGDEYPVVRSHAAWALGQIARRHRHGGAVEYLACAASEEWERSVRQEIGWALEAANGAESR